MRKGKRAILIFVKPPTPYQKNVCVYESHPLRLIDLSILASLHLTLYSLVRNPPVYNSYFVVEVEALLIYA